MLNEITKITFKAIQEAAAAGENITIIINGQYYDLDTTAGIDPEQAFINGVKFAAAVIEDDRARANLVFNGMRNIKRVSKAVIEANYTRNDETRRAVSKLDYILQTNLAPWKNDYTNGRLWKLN